MGEISDLQKEIYHDAVDKGWWPAYEVPNFLEKLALIHSEISEALEEYRAGIPIKSVYTGEDGKPEGVPIELADAIIRILDLSEHYGINISAAIRTKIKFNKTRPYRHGGKLA